MSKSALYEEKRRPRIASPFGYSFFVSGSIDSDFFIIRSVVIIFVPAGL